MDPAVCDLPIIDVFTVSDPFFGKTVDTDQSLDHTMDMFDDDDLPSVPVLASALSASIGTIMAPTQ